MPKSVFAKIAEKTAKKNCKKNCILILQYNMMKRKSTFWAKGRKSTPTLALFIWSTLPLFAVLYLGFICDLMQEREPFFCQWTFPVEGSGWIVMLRERTPGFKRREVPWKLLRTRIFLRFLQTNFCKKNYKKFCKKTAKNCKTNLAEFFFAKKGPTLAEGLFGPEDSLAGGSAPLSPCKVLLWGLWP